MVLFRILLSICLFGYCSYSIAQDSLVYATTQTVTIKADKVDLISKQVNTESKQLVDGLNHTSAVQIQSNGPGLLATPLIHGFGARHTAILWEEFNIQSPINGTFDLGLISDFDRVSYTDKSASAYLGTASLGGAIILDQSNELKSTSAKITLSNTENIRASISHNFQLSKLNSQVSISKINSNNAFNYKWGGENYEWLSQVNGIDLKWNNEYLINERLRFNTNFWISNFDRELPSSLVSASNFANQIDDNYRYQSSLVYTADKYATKLSFAHFDEQLNYKAAGVDSKAKNVVNAINYSIATGTHKFNLSHRTDRADANFFSTKHTRQLSTFSYKYDQLWRSGFGTRLVLTEQLHDGKLSPLLFDLGTNFHSKKIRAGVSFSSAYNTPTLNDLYWPQGGNPDLLPEQSYGIDLSFKYQFNEGSYFSLEPYYKRVSNWILWSPGDQFWSPRNQRSVESKGFDLALALALFDKLKGGFEFTYTNATIAEELTFKELEGKQLLYIPKYKSNIWINYQHRGFQVRPQALFVSKRYTTTDNQNSIPDYLVFDLSVNKEITTVENRTIDIGITGYNLLNKDYQQIEFYPMPLRYFEINLNYKINRK